MNRNKKKDNTSTYVAAGVATAAAGIAAVAGGLYWLTRKQEPPQMNPQLGAPAVRNTPSSSQGQQSSMSDYLNSLLNRMPSTNSGNPTGPSTIKNPKFTSTPAPSNPVISNLNSLLSDIHVRFIQIKVQDFQLHYKVFDNIFQHLHKRMKEVDKYYGKYSSTVQFAGSHYDNLRIKKPDEFDMDIVIDLPLNLREHPTDPADSDVFIEPREAGFVQLKMGVQFQKLPVRDGNEWINNKAAFEWMDSSKYLQRSEFLNWFKSVVNKALNTFEQVNSVPVFYVDGVPYCIGKSESGPAFTMIMTNRSTGFKLDVDLVPALRFPESRWPISPRYRAIAPHCVRGHWLLVAKPVSHGTEHDKRRSWRLALHLQERELMHDSYNLRQAVRLLKKLRDSLGMKKIASYYIKTLFFWEIDNVKDNAFWQKNNPAFLFKLMVGRLHSALVNRNIPYYWNKNNNLIHKVPDSVCFEYAAKLVPLIQILDNPSEYKKVAKYLLEPHEFKDYNDKFLHI